MLFVYGVTVGCEMCFFFFLASAHIFQRIAMEIFHFGMEKYDEN